MLIQSGDNANKRPFLECFERENAISWADNFCRQQ